MDLESQLTSQSQYIRAIAKKRGLADADADDFVQDVAVQCLKSRRRVDWTCFQLPLIRRIARCQLLDQGRRWGRRRARERLTPDIDDEKAVAFDEPSTEMTRREDSARVRLKIAQLEPRLRDVVHARYFEERSDREIALAQQESVETIRTRRKRALKRLATTLLQTGFGACPAQDNRQTVFAETFHKQCLEIGEM
ncbi:MAG: sigma-70 family RNA polymerase sigma factor [Planctomycetia bacterium]|nr:sigma-70 family RNA polymerase sigma factor [Planctomycetia bacterium]